MEILKMIEKGLVTGVYSVGNIVTFNIKGLSAPYIVECKSVFNAELIADKYSSMLVA